MTRPGQGRTGSWRDASAARGADQRGPSGVRGRTRRDASARTAGLFALVVAVALWGGHFAFAAVAVSELSPLGLAAWRWLLAAPALLVLAHFVERPDWRAAARGWRYEGVQSLLGVVGFSLTTYLAMQRVSPTTAALIDSLSPIMILVAAALIARAMPRMREAAGILISLLGVVLVLLAPGSAGATSATATEGAWWMVAATVLWSLYTANGGRGAAPPITATAIQAVIGALVLVPIAAATGELRVELSPQVIGAVIFVAVFPSLVSMSCWNWGVARVGPVAAGVTLNLLPVFAAAAEVALGGSITWMQVIGGALVLGGVALTTRQERGSPERSPAPTPNPQD